MSSSIKFCDNFTVTDGGDPLIQNCKVHDGKQSGIHIYDGGRGRIERCTITNNGGKALDIAPRSNVMLKGNQIQ